MMRYDENTLPVLKYLRWRKKLYEHPDFVKVKNKVMKKRSPSQRMTQPPFPFLIPKNIPAKETDFVPIAIDSLFGFSRIWPMFAEAASSKIEAISNTFMEALDNSYDAFLKAELYKELENQDIQGTLILPGGSVICYDFIMWNPQETDGKLSYDIRGNAIHLEEGKYIVCDNFEDYDIYGEPEGSMSWHDYEKMEWDTSKKDMAPDNNEESPDVDGFKLKMIEGVNENVMGMFDFVLVYHLFKKYAPIDIIESMAKRREHKDLPDIKTSQRINYFDCTWYTTIVRNEGFKVRGHFRLQPYKKDGQWAKKLIYIHEFQKHGYVRRARLILNETKGRDGIEEVE